MSLEEIKEKIAKEVYSKPSVNHIPYELMSARGFNNLIDLVATEFAKEQASQSVQHALEEAADNARLKIEGREGNYKRYFIPLKEEPLIIDKQSILEIKTKYQPITE